MRQRLAPFLVLLEARYAPLLFAVSPQSYAVYLWLFPKPYDSFGEFFAVLGALGYEFVYVGAIAWAEDGKASAWTWITAAVALVFSVLVAYHIYEAQGAWAWLHAGFPLVAFAYTMQLHKMSAKEQASARPGVFGSIAQLALQALQKRLVGAEPLIAANDAARPEALEPSGQLVELPSEPLRALASPSAAVSLVAPSAYICPHCKVPLRNKQALGAATANGYCPACKAKRKAA